MPCGEVCHRREHGLICSADEGAIVERRHKIAQKAFFSAHTYSGCSCNFTHFNYRTDTVRGQEVCHQCAQLCIRSTSWSGSYTTHNQTKQVNQTVCIQSQDEKTQLAKSDNRSKHQNNKKPSVFMVIIFYDNLCLSVVHVIDIELSSSQYHVFCGSLACIQEPHHSIYLF
jgi:hypothetical protein